jgi:ankyrin repeat protein
MKIIKENGQVAEEIRNFVLPYDKQLAPVYFRFNLPILQTYLENSVKSMLQEDVVSWLKNARVATQCAYAADLLEADNFPTTAEDFVALSSLATLLRAFLVEGYTHEARIISDVISNFILYEAAPTEAGSFRKLAIATEAERIKSVVHDMHKIYDDGRSAVPPGDLRSEAAILIGLMAFGDDLEGGSRPPSQLQTPSDYAAGAYYALSVLRRGDQSQMEESRFRNISRQLSLVMGVPSQMDQQFGVKVEALLELAALGALCEAGTIQSLRGLKGLSYNGSLIRRVDRVLRSTSFKGFSTSLLEPFANMFAISIHSNNWSLFRDDAIMALFNAAPVAIEDNWGLVNLALERYNRRPHVETEVVHQVDIVPACKSFLLRYASTWEMSAGQMLEMSVKNGWFGLVRKYVCREGLIDDSKISLGSDFASKEEGAFLQGAKSGFPYILKALVQGLGMERCRKLINRTNTQGQTPLHLACEYRAPKEVFRLLYSFGAYVNSQCHFGRTPLHYCLPNQKAVPPVFDDVLKMVSENSLPTIALLDAPKIYDRYGQGKPVDPRIEDFGALIDQLLCRNADMSIPDQEGLTPVHRAAKEGWGDNLDVFFIDEHGDAEQLQRTCLESRDYAGHTALDHARMTGLTGGEDVLVSEMRKRAMEIPPRTAQLPLNPPTMKMTIGKPRSPAPRASSPQIAPEPPNYPPPATSPAQFPARFPPPLVYQDPEFSSSASYPQTSSQMQEKPNPSSTTNSRTSTFSKTPTLSPTSTLTPSVHYDFKDSDTQSMQSTSTFNSKGTEPKLKPRLFEKWTKKK